VLGPAVGAGIAASAAAALAGVVLPDVRRKLDTADG
jgi:hypothetical protein